MADYTSKFTGEQIDALLDKVGEESSGSALEYLDLTNLSAQAKAYVATCSIEMNVAISYNDNTIVQVAPSALLYSSVGNAIKAYASINLNQPILVAQAGTTTEQTVKDYILSKNITEEEIAAIPRITKEEFYTLN